MASKPNEPGGKLPMEAKSAGGSRGVPHLLVTAGPTRERIDEVREWGNIFTGKTGLDVAMAFLDLGNVTLLTSNENHAREFDGYSGKAGMMGIETFRSHADLMGLLQERMAGGVDVVAMSAAVADYQPVGVYRVISSKAGEDGREVWEVESVMAPKVKSGHERIAVVGTRTVKLIDLFRGAWEFEGVLIKFKLEVGISEEELVRVASDSRLASRADLMVANTLAMARPEHGEGGAYLIGEAGAVRVGRGDGWEDCRMGKS